MASKMFTFLISRRPHLFSKKDGREMGFVQLDFWSSGWMPLWSATATPQWQQAEVMVPASAAALRVILLGHNFRELSGDTSLVPGIDAISCGFEMDPCGWLFLGQWHFAEAGHVVVDLRIPHYTVHKKEAPVFFFSWLCGIYIQVGIQLRLFLFNRAV